MKLKVLIGVILSAAISSSIAHAAGSVTTVGTLKVKSDAVLPTVPTASVFFVGRVSGSTQTVNGGEIRGYKQDASTGSAYNIGFFTRTSSGSALTERLTVDNVGNTTVIGNLGLLSQTATQLRTSTPTAVGQILFNSSDLDLYVGTATNKAPANWRNVRTAGAP